MMDAKSGRGGLSGDLTTLSEALGELDASLLEMRKRIRGVLGPYGQLHEEPPQDRGPAPFSHGDPDVETHR